VAGLATAMDVKSGFNRWKGVVRPVVASLGDDETV